MKKFLALLVALSLFAFAGSAFATTVTASPSSVSVARGSSASSTLTGTPAHSGELSYSVSGAGWASLSGTTVTFTPGEEVVPGDYTITVTVTETYGDPSGAGHSQPLTETGTTTITVTVGASSITATAMPTVVNVIAGVSRATSTVTAAAQNGGTVTYSKVSGADWITISDGTVTFAPDISVTAGEYSAVIRATETFTDASGTSQTATADVTVTAVVATLIPITMTASTTAVNVVAGVSRETATLNSTAMNGGTLAYAKSEGPDWVSVNEEGTVVIEPGASVTAGSYSAKFRATESVLTVYGTTQSVTAYATIAVNVTVVNPITINASSTMVPAAAGTLPGSTTVSAAAANGGTITYSLVTGPTWASVSNSGVVTFAPDASVSAGTYPAAVRATETFTLPDGTSHSVTSSTVTITAVVAAYVIPIAPVSDDINTGDEAAKTSEAVVSTVTETKTTIVTKEVTRTITLNLFDDIIAAAVNLVTKQTATETKETVTESVGKSKVVLTTKTTASADEVMQTMAYNTETGVIADTEQVATSLISTVTEASSEATQRSDTSVAVKTSIASSLMKGGSDSTEGNLSNITEKAITKEDGTLETPGETILRLINEALDAVIGTYADEATKQAIANMVVNGDGSVVIEVKETTTLKTVATTKTITYADGSTEEVTDEETYDINDVTRMLSEQAAGEGNEEELAKLEASIPAAVLGTVEAEEAGVYNFSIQNQKSTWGEKTESTALTRTKVVTVPSAQSSLHAAALDATKVGSSVVLNSAAQETDHIPGENEWTEDGQLIIPGYTVIAMYLEPGVEVTPVLTIPAAVADRVEGVSTTATTAETKSLVTEAVTIADVPVYVSETGAFSTSFDAEDELFFASQGYSTHVGYFVVSGDEGQFTVSGTEDASMLAHTNRAVVRTIPKLDVRGQYASDVGFYAMKVRYDIPLDTDTRTISSADRIDDLLEFWPTGLTDLNEAGQIVAANPGHAIFLDSNREEISADVIRAVAKKQAGYAVSDTSWGYDGYVVMELNALSDDEDPYTPVFTVRTAVKTSEDVEPLPGSEFMYSITGNTTLSVALAARDTSITITPRNVRGTVSYTSSANWVTVNSSTGVVTINPTDSSLVSSTPHTVTITLTDSGRTTANTLSLDLTITVTSGGVISPDEPVVQGLSLNVSPSPLNITLGNSGTVTLSASNVLGTATYSMNAPEEVGGILSGNTAVFVPDEAGTYNVTFTVVDSGRTTGNTATATLTINVTLPSSSVGSSGGGCDAGFGVLALAVLGGFIAARKK